MASTNRLPPKRDVALALLEQSSVFVHLDPRSDSVRVPPWFKKQPQLVLQIGLNMAIPIPDLMIDEEGLSCTLSFNRSPHFCRVPWGSVYALVGENGRGMVWPDDVPPEVAAQVQGQQPGTKPRAHLHAVSAPEPPPPRPVRAAKTQAPKPERPKRARRKAKAVETRATTAGEIPRQPSAQPLPNPKPVPSIGPAPRESVPTQKGKRELPPYLRVVK